MNTIIKAYLARRRRGRLSLAVGQRKRKGTITLANVTIRLANEADVPELTRQTTDISRTTYFWDQNLGSGATLADPLALVAESQGKLIGHIGVAQGFGEAYNVRTGSLNHNEPLPEWWKVHTLAIEPQSQRQGIGSLLLNAVLDQAPRKPPRLVWFHQPNPHAVGIRLVQEKGFPCRQNSRAPKEEPNQARSWATASNSPWGNILRSYQRPAIPSQDNGTDPRTGTPLRRA